MLGRFGGRDADTPGKYQSLKGLRHALEQALHRYRNEPPRERPTPRAAEYAENYPAARRLSPNGCIHCHHVPEFRREALQQAGAWSLDRVWVYPQPENVGLTLDPDQGDRVLKVQADSPAAKIGLQPGDVLRRVLERPVASIADVQHALHHAPGKGNIPVEWQRGESVLQGRLEVADGWRKTDVSWRQSLKSLSPSPGLHGRDLTAEEKQQLGLPPQALAFRQGAFVSPTARHAGIQINDIILGVDDRRLEMSVRQFEAYLRLNYRVGDSVTVNVLRGQQRLRLPMKMTE